MRRIELAFSSRDSLRGRSARVSFFVNALRVSRAVTRLTVYRPHRVEVYSEIYNCASFEMGLASGYGLCDKHKGG